MCIRDSLYTVVNSNAMNGWSSTDTLKTVTPWWQTAIYALIAVMAVLTLSLIHIFQEVGHAEGDGHPQPFI